MNSKSQVNTIHDTSTTFEQGTALPMATLPDTLDSRQAWYHDTLLALASTSYLDASDHYYFEGARLPDPAGDFFLIEKVVSRGNDGVVVLASRSDKIHTPVVLKISAPIDVTMYADLNTAQTTKESPNALVSFLNEVDALKTLAQCSNVSDSNFDFRFPELHQAHLITLPGHPNYRIGMIEMSFVLGQAFSDYLKELQYGYSSIERHTQIAENLKQAIRTMAACDVYHGDIHSENLLIDGSTVGLIDFGRVARPALASNKQAPFFVQGHSFSLNTVRSQERSQDAFNTLLSVDPSTHDFDDIDHWHAFYPENIEKHYVLFP